MALLFVIWIVLFPFILLYGAYEGPKVWWLWMGGFALSIWWLLTRAKPTSWQFLLWILVLLIASIVGVHPIASIIGGGYRHQGVLFFFTLFLIGETIPFLSIRWKKLLDTMLVWGVVIESSIVIFQKIVQWSARPLGTFGEPNAVAGFLAIGLYWVWRTKKMPGAIIVCLAILATGSRSAIIAASIVLCGLLGTKKYVIAVFGVVAVAVIGLARPVSLYENRPLFWTMATKAIVERPILGYGAESSEVVFDQTFARENIRLFDLVIERSHNIFLDIVMWSGLLGLLVFGRWMWEILRHSKIPLVITAWIFFACVQPLGVVHWVQLMLLIKTKNTQEKAL